MMCENCGKKPSTFHMTKVVNGDTTEVHLCEDCASNNKEFDFNFDSSFSIQNLLAGLLDMPKDEKVTTNYIQDIKCKDCGMTYEQFRKFGKFGCSNCHDSFHERLSPLLKKIHGHDTHIGKVPRKAGGAIRIKKDIDLLKNKLQLSVKNEEFEKAADLRDEIKRLQKELEDN
ncbi:putative UvrB/UvrC protein [Gottschalkia acidurici 9a]|uniref:UvrB/UvrC protein n=1 Tax=Gottschalkia acidurici (strain ATCC 7906 / DSM 604 / BCRC 14475 / CIP 104303 / KCTC 5404 / NCIMB 10678 / 9a) TaxID=1128398 RepID=K0B2I4_GOTA9|nr:UvrB/UvrC motif-containing protein [Gottschalkia acidurici]AFS79322.1 putative UvrB/UvrC protein [Gottschalkia acidurici 9a]